MSVEQVTTAEQLWQLPEVPGRRYALAKGELIEAPGAGARRGLIAGLIYRLLVAVAAEHGLSYVFGDGVGYITSRNPDSVRIPDASFVAYDHVPEEGVPQGFWPMAPDLAVEIVSPSDSARDLHAKVREYLRAGTRLVWVVWPDEHAVTVYTSSGAARELGADDVLDGAGVLPGFQTRVAGLFELNQ